MLFYHVDAAVGAGSRAMEGPAGGASSKKRFEVKKWSAVALWAWDIVVDNCAICRNHIMDLCIECQANQVSLIVLWSNVSNLKEGKKIVKERVIRDIYTFKLIIPMK